MTDWRAEVYQPLGAPYLAFRIKEGQRIVAELLTSEDAALIVRLVNAERASKPADTLMGLPLRHVYVDIPRDAVFGQEIVEP